MNPNRSLVCWLVSNCKTPSRREIYVKELTKYVKVDIYGKCGKKVCPMQKVIDCYKWLSKRCKFYLSFENSICEDYVTEKLFYTLLTDMVPIVRGGVNYSDLLPSHSFIDVKEFSTPKDLAERLTILNNDEEQYLAYFRWKEHYEVKNVSYIWLCELCEKLHNISAKYLQPNKEISSWWFSKSSCMYK
ncbi:Alpha-(1,3)-fucosyltransferase C, partial [Stegodyphus mimosarum]